MCLLICLFCDFALVIVFALDALLVVIVGWLVFGCSSVVGSWCALLLVLCVQVGCFV